jgi:hypothetical protein
MKARMNSEAGKQRTAILPLITSGFGTTRWLCLPAHFRREWRCFYGKE